MEAVRAFNNELSSLYEMRPPISRAKMANVTKCGIKAIKFYKHVVQSVEKFIQKCKPEYKVPGLYVIDSIVRQSRHQFNTEKDVFAPRFTKNIVSTFQNLFKCPPDEKNKIVRVLNLWQKNGVFPMEVVQPLLDLAADPNNVELVLTAQRAVERVVSAQTKSHSSTAQASIMDKSRVDPSKTADNIAATQNDMLATVTKLLQQTDDQGITSLSAQQHQLQQLQILQQQLMQQTELMQKPQESGPVIDSNLLAQIQTLTNQLLSKTGGSVSDNPPPEPGFNKKLLDFDYGESDDEEDKKEGSQGMQGFPMSNVQNILNDPNLMHHIHQMSQTMQKNEITVQEQIRQQVLQQQQEEFDKEIKQGPPPGFIPIGMQRLDAVQQQQQMPPQYHNYDHPQPAPDSSVDVEVIDDRDDDKEDRHRSHRDRSRSRSPRKRRRSRSRSRDHRRRSRSRDRHRRSRSRDRDREKTKEKERDRRKKGLPPVREKQLSVCTTTLWLGHLTKHTTEEDIRSEIEKYGTVNSVNLIPPRGCAYVDYARRKDAYKARDKLDRGIRINGNVLKVSWAQGIGVKNPEYKDIWNVDHGVTYIPWSKLPSDLNQLCGGGMIDEDTLPDHLKGMKFGTSEEESRDAPPQAEQTNIPLPMGGQPQYAGPVPGVVPVIPPQLGVMPPMMMPMPGQMPGPMPPGMPPQHIRMPPGPPPGMPPQMAGMPGIGGAPPSSQPVQLSSVLGVSSAISSAPLTMSAASAQLSQAIQSILSTSLPSGQQPQPPTAAAATIVAQPAIPPQARFQGFNPGFNPNMPPPPNIRLPMVGPGMMPAGLRPQFIPTSSAASPAPRAAAVPASESDLDNDDENMDIQDTDERSLSNPEVQPTAVQPGGVPGFAVSRPVGPMHCGPMLRGQMARPMLMGQQHGIGIQMRPMLQMNMGERPRMMIAGDFRPSGPQAVIGAALGAPRQPGPTSLMHTAPGVSDGMRPFMASPRGAPGINRPGLLGLRPGFQRFGPPQGHPGAPQNFRGPRPPFRPNGPPIENPFHGRINWTQFWPR
ncbi:SR-related and CTD-associated factor 4-like [Gigantopelta aegis]|uniref:SR-related and CTD-associated factor 4-like n=1 Tax=Gigantopelta aegis TaxID=1735272 RepID=UPI001B88B038|nr:SR-related and CTD-associated factor 4-like [Gigantopelta aegis]